MVILCWFASLALTAMWLVEAAIQHRWPALVGWTVWGVYVLLSLIGAIAQEIDEGNARKG